MKRSTYSEQQIVKILKEAEAGVSVEALSRQYGFGKKHVLQMESQVWRDGNLRSETIARAGRRKCQAKANVRGAQSGLQIAEGCC